MHVIDSSQIVWVAAALWSQAISIFLLATGHTSKCKFYFMETNHLSTTGTLWKVDQGMPSKKEIYMNLFKYIIDNWGYMVLNRVDYFQKVMRGNLT
jgi:hypothetical protein